MRTSTNNHKKVSKTLELSSIIIVSYLIMICIPIVFNSVIPIVMSCMLDSKKLEMSLSIYKEGVIVFNQNLSGISGIVGMVVGWFFRGKTENEKKC